MPAAEPLVDRINTIARLTGTFTLRSGQVASEYFDRELESRIKTFTTMFEPIMIVFVGVIVGFVAVALVSAMYGVLDGVQTDAGV